MRGIEFAELSAFVAVAEHRSFTKAAARLGLSPPSVSQAIHGLEDRLGVRLLNRTTRSVAPTEAGEQLLAGLRPAMDGVRQAVESINAFRDRPMGALRLAVSRFPAATLIGPIAAGFLAENPDVRLELSVDNNDSDIVSDGFDAGVRVGELIAKDMIAVRIGDAFRLVAAASPAYLRSRPVPRSPKDLQDHNCIQFRQPWDGAIYRWQFEKDGEEVWTTVTGSLTVNDLELAESAALDGVGIVYTIDERIESLVEQQRLIPLLSDWSTRLSGTFIYYSSRRQMPAALKAFIDFARAHRRDHARAA